MRCLMLFLALVAAVPSGDMAQPHRFDYDAQAALDLR